VEVIQLICPYSDIILLSFISILNEARLAITCIYSGRGAFETMGAGVEMSYDDIAFKCNFAYINDITGIVERRRVDREFDWGISLCDTLNDMTIPGYDDYTVKCEYATEHRCGLKVTGKGLSSLITGTDPLKDFKPLLLCEPTDL
jgi:2,3-bisphosphoglycerate-independent phosphoglycerate mutase